MLVTSCIANSENEWRIGTRFGKRYVETRVRPIYTFRPGLKLERGTSGPSSPVSLDPRHVYSCLYSHKSVTVFDTQLINRYFQVLKNCAEEYIALPEAVRNSEAWRQIEEDFPRLFAAYFV